jgi:hypothetical protein
MAASNPFGYNNWLTSTGYHDYKNDSAGDEFLLGDWNDLTAGSDHKDQGNATILVNLANVNMTLAGLNSATGSGVGVFGESDADGTIGVGMGVVGACDMGWGVAGLASTSQIDPNKFPRQVGVLGLGDNVGAAGYGWGTNADGVQGYGHGTFTGVVGFGDPNAEGNGVLGFGGGVSSAANAGGVGVRGSVRAGRSSCLPPRVAFRTRSASLGLVVEAATPISGHQSTVPESSVLAVRAQNPTASAMLPMACRAMASATIPVRWALAIRSQTEPASLVSAVATERIHPRSPVPE